MRQETQPWDRVRATLEIITAGIGVTGKTPTVAIRRISDGNWLQVGGGSWGAGFATNNMSEVDATNLPGFYAYAVPTPQLAHDAGLDGYVVRINEGTTPVVETILLQTLRRSAWDDVRASHTAVGSFGEGTLLATDALTAGAVAASGAAEIAGQVWEELTASHTTGGSFGNLVGNLSATAIADQVWIEQIADHSGVAGSTAERLAGITPAAIADQVWDEASADHNTAGTMGKLLNDAGGAASPSAIADAVWDEAFADHSAVGSTGRALVLAQGLAQANHRIQNPTYDPDGRLLTAQLVVYPTSTDALNDTNALATMNVTSTYDGDGNLLSLVSRE